MTLAELIAMEKEDLDQMNRDLAEDGPPLTIDRIDAFEAFWRAMNAKKPDIYPMFDDDNGDFWFDIIFNWLEGDFTEEWLTSFIGTPEDLRSVGYLPKEN